MDTSGDGVGDFQGLARRLDYLAGLGVTCLWLLPFQPTPNRDNGYDVSDYYGVDSPHGSLGDFVEFSHEARVRGIRVIMDLVINHTSDRHWWFRQARADERSRFRDFYVWSKKKPPGAHDGMVFPGAIHNLAAEAREPTLALPEVAGQRLVNVLSHDNSRGDRPGRTSWSCRPMGMAGTAWAASTICSGASRSDPAGGRQEPR